MTVYCTFILNYLLIVIVNKEIGCIGFVPILVNSWTNDLFIFKKVFSPKTMNKKSTLTYLGMIFTCESCLTGNNNCSSEMAKWQQRQNNKFQQILEWKFGRGRCYFKEAIFLSCIQEIYFVDGLYIEFAVLNIEHPPGPVKQRTSESGGGSTQRAQKRNHTCSMHGQKAASDLLKLFIKGNKRCHLVHEQNSIFNSIPSMIPQDQNYILAQWWSTGRHFTPATRAHDTRLLIVLILIFQHIWINWLYLAPFNLFHVE